MVRLHSVNNLLRNAEFFQKIHSDFHMGPFNFVVNRLADVMKQSRFFRHCHIGADFRRDVSRQVSHLQRVEKNILPVAGPEFQTP